MDRKVYRIIVRKNGDETDEIISFLEKSLSQLDELMEFDVDCEYEDDNNCGLAVDVPQDFEYIFLEDLLDNAGNKCEFISVN